jgi:hypothetical protein
LTPYYGLEVQKPTQSLKSVKSHEQYIKNGKVLDQLGFKSKVLSGHLTDLSAWVGFCTSSQKPTQALKPVKGPGNTFDINSKWSRTLPSLIYFSWDIYRGPPSIKHFSNIKVDI